MKAITHPGQAHADDVLTAAYLIAKGLVTQIERREPTREEIIDDETIVFDIGGQHSQDANNFDHHQFDRDVAATCAFSLVLMKHGDYDDWRSIYPWLAGVEEMDSKGPFAVVQRLAITADPSGGALGLTFDVLKPFFFSPFASFIIGEFEKETVINGASGSWHLLRRFGLSLIEQVETIRERWTHFDATTNVETVKGVFVGVFDTTGPVGIESWIENRSKEINCVVSKDDRGDGLALFRRNDDQRIDFSRCEGMANVAFAHKNGFVAKITDRDWLPVVEKSI